MIHKPHVELFNYTPHALETMIYTKSTRLQGRQTLQKIIDWPYEKKIEELNYMRDTIKSSWEFVDYIFFITGVSREFTHQFVRTRDFAGVDDPAFGQPDANFAVASFAQESQRTVDASGNGFVLPTTLSPENASWFEMKLDSFNEVYMEALGRGEPPQNARALLPTAVSTSIIVKASLRALHHAAEVRLCTRTQGQYQDVFRMMRQEILAVHPWAESFINVYCVNNGTCCFPRYKQCPVQPSLFNPETGLRYDELQIRPSKRSEIFKIWSGERHEARPVARDGKTM